MNLEGVIFDINLENRLADNAFEERNYPKTEEHIKNGLSLIDLYRDLLKDNVEFLYNVFYVYTLEGEMNLNKKDLFRADTSIMRAHQVLIHMDGPVREYIYSNYGEYLQNLNDPLIANSLVSENEFLKDLDKQAARYHRVFGDIQLLLGRESIAQESYLESLKLLQNRIQNIKDTEEIIETGLEITLLSMRLNRYLQAEKYIEKLYKMSRLSQNNKYLRKIEYLNKFISDKEQPPVPLFIPYVNAIN